MLPIFCFPQDSSYRRLWPWAFSVRCRRVSGPLVEQEGLEHLGFMGISGNIRTYVYYIYIYGYIIYIILNSSYEIIRISMKVIWKYAEIWVGFMYVCVHIYIYIEIDSRKVGNLEHYGGNIIDSSHPGNTKNYLFVGYYG